MGMVENEENQEIEGQMDGLRITESGPIDPFTWLTYDEVITNSIIYKK